MGLFVRADDVPAGQVQVEQAADAAGGLSTKQVVGTASSMMIARRTAGYHSKPHVHDCEQLNYMLDGELSIFVDKNVYHLKKGDFLRIPPNVVHWSWNRSEKHCELFECHAPALDLLPRDQSIQLLNEEEDINEIKWVPNIFVSEEHMDIEERLLD